MTFVNQEPLTLYKLIILYILNKVSFPITATQISDFILDKEYTTFLNLQQAFSELQDASLISGDFIRNRTHLKITKEGINTLDFFENRINDAIKKDITTYLIENEFDLKNEVSIVSDYYKSTSGEYEAHLMAKDKNICLVDIKLSVPIEEMAASICEKWSTKNQAIYKYLTEQLF